MNIFIYNNFQHAVEETLFFVFKCVIYHSLYSLPTKITISWFMNIINYFNYILRGAFTPHYWLNGYSSIFPSLKVDTVLEICNVVLFLNHNNIGVNYSLIVLGGRGGYNISLF